MLYPHHQRTVERLIQRFSPDPNFLALLVGGSLAKGYGDETSDVDIVLIATDAEYERRQPEQDFNYFTTDLCDYPGGYVDGKIVDVAFLEEVADRGSEPARSAFEGNVVAFSKLPQLADLLQRITAYPEAERTRKIQSFYAQLLAAHWYVGEATKRRNAYLLQRMTAELVLYSGRLILAHNRALYPYHKWFLRRLAEVPDKPSDLLPLIDAVLTEATPARADALRDCVINFTAWDTPPGGWPGRFMQDTEWAWRTGRAAVTDW